MTGFIDVLNQTELPVLYLIALFFGLAVVSRPHETISWIFIGLSLLCTFVFFILVLFI